METAKMLMHKIGHIEDDIVSVKKEIIKLNMRNNKDTEIAWADIMAASKDISKSWRGQSAIEEIRKQREKN